MLCSNGLVDILDENNNEDINNKFKLMDKIPVKTINTICSKNIGNVETTVLSDAFFSNQNIIIIQNAITRGVYDATNKIIDKQNANQLLGIMRNVFMEDCRGDFISNTVMNKPLSDRDMIIKLNNRVVNLCVNSIKNELISYYKYREDISTMALPQDLPILSNSKNKTLELKPWF
mgnify:CR=1 FL=1